MMTTEHKQLQLGINHVSVRAANLEESVAFYEDLFGEYVQRIPTPNFNATVQWLKLGSGQLHLFEVDIPKTPRYQHFGVTAASPGQYYEIFLKAKERGIFDPVTYGYHLYELPGGNAQMYVLDPTENLVELDWPDINDLPADLIAEAKRFVDIRPQPQPTSLFLPA